MSTLYNKKRPFQGAFFIVYVLDESLLKTITNRIISTIAKIIQTYHFFIRFKNGFSDLVAVSDIAAEEAQYLM